MKKLYLTLSLIGLISNVGAQVATKAPHAPVKLQDPIQLNKENVSLEDRTKTLLCVDTVRYSWAKELVLNPVADEFYLFDIWASDNEAITQTYLHSGSPMSISGIEFYGASNTTYGNGTVTVRASIYSVNASYVPQTELAFGTITFTNTAPQLKYVNFAPINVTGNYAVVITPTNPGGVMDIIVNDIDPGQAWDENLARYKSSFYASSGGNWITIPQFTEIGNYHFEPLASPIVSYTITTTGTASPTAACQGTPVTFTNTTTPTSILSNRMFNYNVMMDYFNVATSDSTFVWDMDNSSPLIWSGNTSYTYPAAGTYEPALFTLGGLWNSCVDFDVETVVINALPTVTASASSSTICAGGSTTLTPLGATSYSWNNGIGAVESPTVSPTTTTTYQVTGTGANSCTNTANVTVNVNPVTDANFNYTSNTICTSGGNVTPTTANAGTFSSTTGLVFANTTTGEIDVISSNQGTYTITHTTGGTCPGTASQTITLTDAPDATFTYAQTSFCSNASNPNPVFTTGSAGTFSSTTGLVFVNANTGQINLAASTPGSYTVTNTIPGSGSCPSDIKTFNVTINSAPSATVTGGGTACGEGSVPVDVIVNLGGVGPWNVTYTNGAVPNTITGQTTSPLVISATEGGTYTVTNVSNANCSAGGTGSATVVFNPNPNVAMTTLYSICDNAGLTTLNGIPSGGTFTGTPMTGNQFDPNQTPGVYSITYTYTDDNGCSGSASQDVTVLEAPEVTLAVFENACIQDGQIPLSGGTPTGGSFSGTNVTDDIFDAAAAGVGTHNIVYTFIASNSCSASISQNITVEDCLGLPEASDIEVIISPNPANEVLFLNNTSNTGTLISYTMFAENGQVVNETKELKAGTNVINVSQMSAGVYFLQFTSESGSSIKKVIIK
jgi:hypothetical protein